MKRCARCNLPWNLARTSCSACEGTSTVGEDDPMPVPVEDKKSNIVLMTMAELGVPNDASVWQIRQLMIDRLRPATAEELGLPPPLDLVPFCSWDNGHPELRWADSWINDYRFLCVRK